MGRSINKVTLLGNVGREPEVRTTANGKKVANFSIATSRKSGGEDKTAWHRCVAWDKTAETVELYVFKGDKIYVEGEIEYGSYDKNGVTIPTCDINVREIVLLGSKNEPASNVKPAPNKTFEDPGADLPF